MDHNTKLLLFFMTLLVFPQKILLTFSAANQPWWSSKRQTHKRSATSLILPIRGNVFPDGYYYVPVSIGNPPKTYYLDVDTGSDLTWVQCDAPCHHCIAAPNALYKPSQTNLVPCKDSLCSVMHYPSNFHCKTSDEQCDYEVEYADSGSSLGVLMRDYFPLRFTNGSLLGPKLGFGCGYDQRPPNSYSQPYTDGVLGLGSEKLSLVSQLSELGLTRNVVGHCLSSRGGGFIFFGDEIVPSLGIIWMPMSSDSLMKKYYSSGPADLHFGTQVIDVKNIPILFDSGSSYTYLNSDTYKVALSLIRSNLNGKSLRDAPEDRTLPICWKGDKRFKSISDVKRYFNPFVLKFTNTNNVLLHIPPEGYLIVTEKGNVCLGILNGTEAGLGNLNIMGDISMQDKMVIFDNEKRQIGWVPANCDRLPKS